MAGFVKRTRLRMALDRMFTLVDEERAGTIPTIETVTAGYRELEAAWADLPDAETLYDQVVQERQGRQNARVAASDPTVEPFTLTNAPDAPRRASRRGKGAA